MRWVSIMDLNIWYCVIRSKAFLLVTIIKLSWYDNSISNNLQNRL